MAVEILPQEQPKPTKSEQSMVDYYSFEGQFRKKHNMEVGGKKVDYLRISPPPEKTTFDTPAVLLPGFTENPDLLKKILKKLYDDGRHVFTLTYPRERLNTEQNRYPQAQDQKIEATLGLITEARNVIPGKVDLVGRSDGGVNATYAAAKHPEWIDNLILLDTKLTAQEKPVYLFTRFLKHASIEGKELFTNPLEQTYLRHGVEQGIKYVLPHIPRSIEEIIALAHSDIRQELPRLREKGVGVYGIHGTGDSIFPMNGLQKGVAEAGGKQKNPEILMEMGLTKKTTDKQGKTIFIKDAKVTTQQQTLFDGFYSAKANVGHASIYNNDAYVNLISHVLQAARAKTEKSSVISQQSGPEDR